MNHLVQIFKNDDAELPKALVWQNSIEGYDYTVEYPSTGKSFRKYVAYDEISDFFRGTGYVGVLK